jgi:hypothetical protein
MVARAVPDVWQRASPEQALAARLDGAVRALRAILPAEPDRWAEAADLLEPAARAVETGGRGACWTGRAGPPRRGRPRTGPSRAARIGSPSSPGRR